MTALAVLAALAAGFAGLPGFAAAAPAAGTAQFAAATTQSAAGTAQPASPVPGSGTAGAAREVNAFGKPVAPISLDAEPAEPASVGVPVAVRVRLATSVQIEDIEVRISADEGLSVDLADLTLRAPSASPEQPAEWLISVVPLANGAQRLRLYGEALIEGRRQGRSVVATIRVGAVDDAKRASGVSGAKGESAARAAEDVSGVRAGNESSTAAPAEPAAERVIRLPATPRR